MIKFLRGIYSDLPSETIDGTIYFCTDTSQLFIDYGNERIEININKLNKDGDTIGAINLTPNKTYGDTLPNSLGENQLFFVKMNIYDYLYPVGSIYLTAINTNPATLFGVGTWSSITSPISGKYAFQRTA